MDHPPAAATEPISPVDHAWLRMDDPTNLMLINGVLALDGPVDLERLKSVIAHRLLPIRRFRQRVVLDDGAPRWELDPAFDLEQHLVRMRLPDPGGDAELRPVVSELMSLPLDRSRPLWEFRIIENYRGGTAVMGRLHHAIGDGMALLLVLLSLADLAPDSPSLAGLPEGEEGRHGNPFTELFQTPMPDLDAIRAIADRVMPDGMRLLTLSAEAFGRAGPLLTGVAGTGALGRLVARLPDPKTRFKGPLRVEKCAAWSEPLAMADVRAVGKAMGGTVNDVLLSAMVGGLRRYLEHRGERWQGLNFRAAMPVNLRPLEKMAELGNQFGLVFLSLPVGIADPASRLAELRRRATALKRSAEPVVVYAILKLLGLSPMAFQKLVVKIFAAKTTAVMTNVPGPRETLWVAGVPVRDIFFWVPQSGRVGLGISIFSYAGKVRLGVGTDAGLIPDPEAIVDGFHEEFAAMCRLAAAPQ